MHFIPDWHTAHRLWSVRITALGATLMAALLAFPDLWAALPPEARALLPERFHALVPMLLLAASLFARLTGQPVAQPPLPMPLPTGALGLMARGTAPGVGYDRERLAVELVRDEGERLKVYRCTAGKRTIGVGRNLDDVGISNLEAAQLGITTASAVARGITRPQSRALLANDIARCERDLDARLPWWRKLDPVRQRVLLNMCFNLGISGLCGFHNTLRAIEAGRWQVAVAGMKASKWHRQVGVRAERLEAMMATGR